MRRTRQAVRVPLSEAQKAQRRAKRAENKAIEQARTAALLRALQRAGVPLVHFERQVPFYGLTKTAHPWYFDIADKSNRVAIEIDGGGYAGKPCPLCGQRPGGRHNRGDRERERRKLNEAQAMGWRIFAFSGTAVDRHPDECADLVRMVYR